MMKEQEREQLTQALVDVAVLKIEVAALQELVIALAVALTEKPNGSLADTAATMDAIHLLTRWTKGENTADGMAYVINNIKALSHAPPLQSLAAAALLHLQAGDSMRAPLQSWLAQATQGEIEQDLLQALRKLPVEDSPPRDDDESQGS